MHETQLQRPGAGLPLPELLLLRFWIYPRYGRSATWESCQAQFAREAAKILKLCDGLDALRLEQRVLIPRPRGLEDSSRHWSLAMTMEHLMIVGRAVGQVIVDLSHKREPSVSLSIAGAKPLGSKPGPQLLQEFRDFSATHTQNIFRQLGDRDSKLRSRHPWLGRLTARGWMWMMGSHQALHRKQMEQIRRIGGV